MTEVGFDLKRACLRLIEDVERAARVREVLQQ